MTDALLFAALLVLVGVGCFAMGLLVANRHERMELTNMMHYETGRVNALVERNRALADAIENAKEEA